jgi:hypothetical protein
MQIVPGIVRVTVASDVSAGSSDSQRMHHMAMGSV